MVRPGNGRGPCRSDHGRGGARPCAARPFVRAVRPPRPRGRAPDREVPNPGQGFAKLHRRLRTAHRPAAREGRPVAQPTGRDRGTGSRCRSLVRSWVTTRPTLPVRRRSEPAFPTAPRRGSTGAVAFGMGLALSGSLASGRISVRYRIAPGRTTSRAAAQRTPPYRARGSPRHGRRTGPDLGRRNGRAVRSRRADHPAHRSATRVRARPHPCGGTVGGTLPADRPRAEIRSPRAGLGPEAARAAVHPRLRLFGTIRGRTRCDPTTRSPRPSGSEESRRPGRSGAGRPAPRRVRPSAGGG
jgi:hypothetical protein